MISRTLQIVMILAVAVYFVLLFLLLKKRSLHLKYTLLWIFSGILMLVLAVHCDRRIGGRCICRADRHL